MRQIPNALTIIRLLLVIPIVFFIWTNNWTSACVLTLFAGLTDVLDGVFARKFDWVSQFGKVMDPIADKVLFGTIFIALTAKGHIPAWITIIVVSRDLVIMAGAMVYKTVLGAVEIAPMFLSKVTTAVQIFLLVFNLAALADIHVAERTFDPIVWWILAVLTIVSGLGYIVSWGIKAKQEWPNRCSKEEAI